MNRNGKKRNENKKINCFPFFLRYKRRANIHFPLLCNALTWLALSCFALFVMYIIYIFILFLRSHIWQIFHSHRFNRNYIFASTYNKYDWMLCIFSLCVYKMLLCLVLHTILHSIVPTVYLFFTTIEHIIYSNVIHTKCVLKSKRDR